MVRGLASFDIYVIVSELQELLGGYVEKIYQLTRDEILIKVHQSKKNRKEQIFIRNGALLCTTDKTFDAPEKPSVFSMTLRKYLINGTISEITQHEFDRIVKIKIGRKEGDYTLICELFSKGNIILVNPEGRIIRPMMKQEWAGRLVKSGEMYVPPPSQTNPFTLSKENFKELLQKSKKDLVRTLASSVNLSGLYAEELCKRAGLEKNITSEQMTDESIQTLYQTLQELLEIFRKKAFQPTLVKHSGTIVDILPFPFLTYSNEENEATSDFSRSLQYFIDVQRTEHQEKSNHQKKIEQLQRQLRSQQEMIREFKTLIEQRKKEGDLIYLNYQPCQKILEDISLLLKQKEKTEAIEVVRKNPLVKRFDPLTNDLIIVLDEGNGSAVDIVLDFRKTIAENAQHSYEESKKIQEKLKGALLSIEQTRHDIETAKDNVVVEKKKEIRREKTWWFERFRWFLSTEGNLVVAGRDAQSNDHVVKKYLKEGDRYAHADIHGAPSCVIKSRGINDEQLPISEKTLEEACCFAASYSKAWNQYGEAQAYWVLPEQVSKTPNTGEFLPKGAFVIRGKRNYYRCTLELAVGYVMIGDIGKMMGGPVGAIESRTSQYIVLTPGMTKKSDIAQKLAKIFQVSTEEVEKVLPPGTLTVTKAVGLEWK